MGLMQRSAGILFKYKEGTWNECRKALEHLYQTECSPENILRLNSEEEVYNNYLRSEEMLTRLLSFRVFSMYSYRHVRHLFFSNTYLRTTS